MLQNSHVVGSVVFPIPYAFSAMLDELGFVSALVREGFDNCLCKSHSLGVFSCFVLHCPICTHNLSHQVFWLHFDRAWYEFFFACCLLVEPRDSDFSICWPVVFNCCD